LRLGVATKTKTCSLVSTRIAKAEDIVIDEEEMLVLQTE